MQMYCMFLLRGTEPVLPWFSAKALIACHCFPFKNLEVNPEVNESRHMGLVWM